MAHHLLPDTRQYDTHEELLGTADSPAAPLFPQALDAIIVPASRPAEHLDHAIRLAHAVRRRLVVLCSRLARADEINELLASRPSVEAVVIELPAGYSHQWLEFATSRPQKIGQMPEACAARDSDLSIKRNIGLILARMVGWSRVFFMDDDIRNVSAGDLTRTVSTLAPHYRTAGMKVTDFPDNSVVCHAHRATGRFQDVLVGGSVLAVDCAAPIGFFPDVYNEDWLFFYDDAADRRLAWSGVNAEQLRYDPFDEPRRAAEQEFGDVLGEGLYALLHRGQNAAHATQDYWFNFLDARKGFLDAIIARANHGPAAIRERMLNSVRAARECSAEIQPEFCEHYVRLWRKDLGRWEQTLREIPQALSIAKALAELDLAAAGRTERRPAASGDLASTVTAAAPVPNGSLCAVLSDDSADLAQLGALARAYCMERLQRTFLRADHAAGASKNHGRKLAATSKMVGVLVIVRVIVALNRVRLTLSADGCIPPGRRPAPPGGGCLRRSTVRHQDGNITVTSRPPSCLARTARLASCALATAETMASPSP